MYGSLSYVPGVTGQSFAWKVKKIIDVAIELAKKASLDVGTVHPPTFLRDEYPSISSRSGVDIQFGRSSVDFSSVSLQLGFRFQFRFLQLQFGFTSARVQISVQISSTSVRFHFSSGIARFRSPLVIVFMDIAALCSAVEPSKPESTPGVSCRSDNNDALFKQ